MEPLIILDKRTPIIKGENKGRYHIKIKASFVSIVNGAKKWKPKRAKTNIFASPKEFKSIMGNPRSADLKDKRKELNKILAKANHICNMPGLTPTQFINLLEQKENFDSVIELFDWYKAKLEREERHGTASAIQDAKKSFQKFKGDTISFAEITIDWLTDYKRWMKSEGKSNTTIYIYCRALRTIMNIAADPLRKIAKESIPFGKGKFKIPASKKGNRKVQFNQTNKELLEIKNKILTYISDDDRVNKALNYWRASFFGNGCNMADLARWQYKHINNNIITFHRKKTENTEENPEPITVYISPALASIIKTEGNKSLDPTAYVFPIITNDMDPKTQYKTIKHFIKITNKYLAIATTKDEMNLPIPLSTCTARYMMSTLLLRAGIDLTAIRDMLGHASTSTTEHYAQGSNIDLMKLVNNLLVG